MPRRDFVADLKKAQEGLHQSLISISPGQDDGTIILLFRLGSHQFRLHLQISDVGDYPRSHSFFVFSDSDDELSESVASAISKIPLLERLSVSQAIAEILAVLNSAPDTATQSASEALADQSDEDDDYGDYDYDYDNYNDDFHYQDEESNKPHYSSDKRSDEAIRDRVQQDLWALKKAGFRVSHSGSILKQDAPCFLMVSIRTSKLGIPENALEAWHLKSSEYVMLLLKYRHGYCSLDRLYSSAASTSDVEMFVLVTKYHKLTNSEISYAVGHRAKKYQKNAAEVPEKVSDQSVRSLFISSALEELLNSRLLTLIRYRLDLGLNWDGAMTYYNDMQGVIRTEAIATEKHYTQQDEAKLKNLPELLQTDHIRECSIKNPSSQILAALSFPYIAMEFTLRHTVRCTEFCLVCFDRTSDSFEALKPYVCSKPLCLFQYMSMGFGPGIEFEILSQKYVVDLLISFCYAATSSNSLTSLPIGLGLMVPDPELVFGHNKDSKFPRTFSSAQPEGMLLGQWNPKTCEIALPGPSNDIPRGLIKGTSLNADMVLSPGDWIVFWSSDLRLRHCQITDVGRYRYKIMILSKANEGVIAVKSDDNEMVCDIAIVPYRRLFDSLNTAAQCTAIRMMLDTLPDVEEMAAHISGSTNGHLAEWKERMIPSAVGILRWIIASNRSCIVQERDHKKLVHGMPGYVQFRFASGAPDKESRFVECVNSMSRKTRPSGGYLTGSLNWSSTPQAEIPSNPHPTIFAWHGSPLKNWHSIVREGLHFKQIVNGRAYGNGVYHALQSDVSLGYSRIYDSPQTQSWPSSKLRTEGAISLNEIVNAPADFQSRSPYLVVQHIDWIQTRYLFIKCHKENFASLCESDPNLEQQCPPRYVRPQDPTYYPVGIGKVPLVIPDHSSAQISTSSDSLDDSVLSDESDADDILLYASASEGNSKSNKGLSLKKSGAHCSNRTCTVFEPGSLDRSNLPILASPSYATPLSSKILQRELQQLLKEQQQQQTTLSELGWYLDPDHIDNTYHWIVELHSFDLDLPLAKDMEEQGIKSIVIEIRFGPNFNFSPPFIRVVRPRFLEFAQGGGGHVTAGGALCMQLLTSDGWNASATMSAVLLQIRMAITSTDPRPARLSRGSRLNEYSPFEAVEAYKRACHAHGWKIPDDLAPMLAMTGPVPGSSSVIPQKRPAMT